VGHQYREDMIPENRNDIRQIITRVDNETCPNTREITRMEGLWGGLYRFKANGIHHGSTNPPKLSL
jgi:hypothetical protein